MKRALILLSLIPTLAMATTTDKNWQATSVQTQAGQAQSAVLKSSRTGQSQGSMIQQQGAKKLSARGAVQQHDVWVYDAFVSLYRDHDYDGYYSGITLEFDVDTSAYHSDVYARIYLGVDDEFYEYYTTNIFSIDGESSDDSLIVETELVQGFYPDDYEVLIEIYDAYSNALVAVYDGYDDADLVYLPLESKDYDRPQTAQVTVTTEYGGSMAWLLGLLLPVMWLKRRNG